MGCGETLFLGTGNLITCSYIDCPRPTAAGELLSQPNEHIVSIERSAFFSLAHPLAERLDLAVFECPLHSALIALDKPPVKDGIYRLTQTERGLHFAPLAAEVPDDAPPGPEPQDF